MISSAIIKYNTVNLCVFYRNVHPVGLIAGSLMHANIVFLMHAYALLRDKHARNAFPVALKLSCWGVFCMQ